MELIMPDEGRLAPVRHMPSEPFSDYLQNFSADGIHLPAHENYFGHYIVPFSPFVVSYVWNATNFGVKP